MLSKFCFYSHENQMHIYSITYKHMVKELSSDEVWHQDRSQEPEPQINTIPCISSLSLFPTTALN